MNVAITSQSSHVFHPDDLPRKDRGGGAATIPFVTYERGATSYLNGTTIFQPGAQIGHHTHNVAESVTIVEGRAIVDIEGKRTEVGLYDTTFVPANVPHHFENASDKQPMRIFWTYGSIDATRTLVGSGAHGRIDAESDAGATGSAAGRPVEENALFTILDGHEADFEHAVAQAIPLFQTAIGARTFTLRRSVEHPEVYQLRILWESVEAHTVSFRESDAYKQWRGLVGKYFASNPAVQHYSEVLTGF